MDFSGVGDINLETVIAAIALIGTAIAWLLDRYVLRRKRLVYRVQVDAPIGVYPSSHMVDVEVRHQGAVVPDPSVVLLRVDNAGGMDVEPHDMHEQVSFAFPDRKIVGLGGDRGVAGRARRDAATPAGLRELRRDQQAGGAADRDQPW